MKSIIPFKKDVTFKTKLSEITSISLENTLNIEEGVLKGDFIISGDYKVSDKSTTVEPFDIKLPFEIVIEDRYDSKRATVDIDDFYYEIVNNNVLSISIDVLVDKLQDKPLIEVEDLIDVTPVREVLESEDNMEKEEILDVEEREVKVDKVIEEVKVDEVIEEAKEVKEVREDEAEFVEEKINSLFNQFSKDSEVYVSYNVFIIRDGDSLDTIMEKYNVTEEELKKYNDLSNLQLGDKIIIPNTYERN